MSRRPRSHAAAPRRARRRWLTVLAHAGLILATVATVAFAPAVHVHRSRPHRPHTVRAAAGGQHARAAAAAA